MVKQKYGLLINAQRLHLKENVYLTRVQVFGQLLSQIVEVIWYVVELGADLLSNCLENLVIKYEGRLNSLKRTKTTPKNKKKFFFVKTFEGESGVMLQLKGSLMSVLRLVNFFTKNKSELQLVVDLSRFEI